MRSDPLAAIVTVRAGHHDRPVPFERPCQDRPVPMIVESRGRQELPRLLDEFAPTDVDEDGRP
jgi:hypothetical protein